MPALLVALVAIVVAFTVSASAGLGGSLILVPALSILLGAKEGIALSALLLGGNNVLKVLAYRRMIPYRAALSVVLLIMLGAAIGARLMVAAPERWVDVAIILSFGLSFLFEFKAWNFLRRGSAPLYALFAGATSGFSGTSGPLKGVALRNLGLDRLHLVGAASLASLAGDAVKAGIFLQASLLEAGSWRIVLWALPLMPLAVLLGRAVNERIGERAYASLFWAVMTGYAVRLVLA